MAIQTLPSAQPRKPAAQQALNLAQNTNKNRKHPKQSSQDKRLFIRLPENYEWRKLSPAGIREREYQAVVRAKTAEERAKTAEKGNNLVHTSSSTAVSIKNIQASSTESSTDDAMQPWWSGCTKSHPGFDCHLSFGAEGVRPRAITYTIRNQNRIIATQKFLPERTGDYCWVLVNDVNFLNVYKTPQDPTAVLPLLNWTPPSRAIAIGDFNSVHWTWQLGVRHMYGQGEEIEKWAEEHNLSCLIVGEPTHRAGKILDLVWTNIGGTCAWVEREECVTSDHLPICGSVISKNEIRNTHKDPLRVSKDKLPRLAQVVAQWISPTAEPNSVEEIELLATDLCRTLQDALEAVG
ncbi:hypothetical protein EPUL_004972 [Erysiphe pulchra]|uniref:Endonuclease/exonuclease/phosphatase domain-containing protein n=1 Tax=Erysiphe pulchra TaxID=225359 RepID=A0A2S4PK88_9PEZI|nr:hypothetical protein EPUL_004972 [Erysiphe pulchra]